MLCWGIPHDLSCFSAISKKFSSGVAKQQEPRKVQGCYPLIRAKRKQSCQCRAKSVADSGQKMSEVNTIWTRLLLLFRLYSEFFSFFFFTYSRFAHENKIILNVSDLSTGKNLNYRSYRFSSFMGLQALSGFFLRSFMSDFGNDKVMKKLPKASKPSDGIWSAFLPLRKRCTSSHSRIYW